MRNAASARTAASKLHHRNEVKHLGSWVDYSKYDSPVTDRVDEDGDINILPVHSSGRRRRGREELDFQRETLSSLYDLLRTSASRGNTREVQELVTQLVKKRFEKPNLRLYGSLILTNVNPQEGSVFKVRAVLDEMQDEGLVPDSGICHDVLKVLSVHTDYLLRADILEFMKQRWMVVNETGQHSVVAGFLRDGQLELACEWLSRMRKDNIKIEPWLLDMAVYLLVDGGEFEEARHAMRDRLDNGELDISKDVWHHLLDNASAVYNHKATVLAWNSQVNLGYINPSSGLCANVLATAARAGDVSLATDVFRILGQRATLFTIAHYEQLVDTYLKADPPDLRAALSVLTIMAGANLEPTTTSTRQLYAFLDKWMLSEDKALEILTTLQEQGRRVPLAALNVLLEVMCKYKRFEKAMTLYKSMHNFEPPEEPSKPRRPMANIETFNILFKGARWAKSNPVEQAMFLASEQLALGIKPNVLTYDRVILLCINDDKLDHAMRYLDECEALEWLPRHGTLGALAIKLAEKGDERCWDTLQKARDSPDESGLFDHMSFRRRVERALLRHQSGEVIKKNVRGGEGELSTGIAT